MSLRAGIVLVTIGTSFISVASSLYAANAPTEARQDRTTVHLADLNLDRPADVALMFERINLAAEQVCRQRALDGSYVLSLRYEHCVADTVAKVVASINRAPLTSFSRQRDQMRVASAAPL